MNTYLTTLIYKIYCQQNNIRTETMKQNKDSELFEIGDSQQQEWLTDIEVICHTTNSVLLRAKRQGEWLVLKGSNKAHNKQTSLHAHLLRKEYDIQHSLSHPNIAKVYAFENVAGYGQCIVQEWIDGTDLCEWLKGKPKRAERLKVLQQLLNAVEYLHSKQVVHRDLKPANVMITRNGSNVKIIDFGLADTDAYAVLKQPSGTRGYLSPEQEKASITDCRNDMYSLGCIISDLHLGRWYNGIIKRCKQPLGKRYGNVGELKKALHRIALLKRGLLALMLLIAVALGVWTWYNVQEENGRPRYEEVAQFRVANIKYTSWGGLAASAQLAEMKEQHIVVPAEVKDKGLTYLVSELGFDCFKNDTLLTKLVVQCRADTMNILKGAFKGCNNLSELYLISDKLVGIGSDIWPCSLNDVFDTHHYNSITIYVPKNMLNQYEHSIWRRFKHIETIK